MKSRRFGFLTLAMAVGLFFLTFTPLTVGAEEEEESDPAEIAIGERLFLETRFAQFFFANSGGDANAELVAGDPVMDFTETPNGLLPGPFAGQSMNCSACHLVDAQLDTPGGGMRTYTDFARRSPVPDRIEDILTHAPRNSPPLVNASLEREGGLLVHFDGEFSTMDALVKATLTGRNYGWLAGEHATAISHVVHIIKNDDGAGDLALEFGGAYADVLIGDTDPEFVLPEEFQIDVTTATNDEIFDAVAKILSAYVLDLAFGMDDDGEFNLSPYDVFLEKNGLDRKPHDGETDREYSQRLLTELNALESPEFVVDGVDGSFQFHDQAFAFGADELKGLKIFLTEKDSDNPGGVSVGNCSSCHAAPNFTDFSFHNTVVAQNDYDAVHGSGKFITFQFPGLQKRLQEHEKYLPASPFHPNATRRFRSIPTPTDVTQTDIGLWNVFANPDFPAPQEKIWNILCEREIGKPVTAFDMVWDFEFLIEVVNKCNAPILLPKTVALFKTPGLRDLGHSNPYMHTGREDTIEDVVSFYLRASEATRAGIVLNPAPEMEDIHITQSDIDPLTKFLKALNEDYE